MLSGEVPVYLGDAIFSQFVMCNVIMWNIKQMRTEVAIYHHEEPCSLW